MSQTRVISIVDDDALARDGIRELVESLGYEVLTFVSAEHFLQSGSIAQTVCLISDIQMPGLTGGQLIDEIQRMNLPIPILVITAYGDQKLRRGLSQKGCPHCLDKPFDEGKLLEKVFTILKEDRGCMIGQNIDANRAIKNQKADEVMPGFKSRKEENYDSQN